MKMTVEVASLPDRDNLVAELWCDNEQWGEVSQEAETLQLEIYPRPNTIGTSVWSFDLNEVMNILKEAQKKLGSVD